MSSVVLKLKSSEWLSPVPVIAGIVIAPPSPRDCIDVLRLDTLRRLTDAELTLPLCTAADRSIVRTSCTAAELRSRSRSPTPADPRLSRDERTCLAVPRAVDVDVDAASERVRGDGGADVHTAVVACSAAVATGSMSHSSASNRVSSTPLDASLAIDTLLALRAPLMALLERRRCAPSTAPHSFRAVAVATSSPPFAFSKSSFSVDAKNVYVSMRVGCFVGVPPRELPHNLRGSGRKNAVTLPPGSARLRSSVSALHRPSIAIARGDAQPALDTCPTTSTAD